VQPVSPQEREGKGERRGRERGATCHDAKKERKWRKSPKLKGSLARQRVAQRETGGETMVSVRPPSRPVFLSERREERETAGRDGEGRRVCVCVWVLARLKERFARALRIE
jgi:hypothetical protein